MKEKILILGGDLVLSDRILKDGIILIEGNSLSFVGDASSFMARYGLKAVTPGVLGIDTVFDLRDKVIVPALVEMHIHGAGGYDFETPAGNSGLDIPDDGEIERFEICMKFLSSMGVGIFLPTIVFDEYVTEKLAAVIKYSSDRSSLIKNRIPGIYIEGPFISREKRGGIRDEYIMDFSEEVFERIYSLSLGLLRVMTFAPEIEKADRLLDVLIKHRVIPAFGHSNCGFGEVESLVRDRKKKSTGEIAYNVTHLFNGMSGVSHKIPGLAHWALLEDFVYTELNCDETHVHPLGLRLAFKLRPWEKIIMISDAISASGYDDSDNSNNNNLGSNPPLLRGRRVYVKGNGVYDFETRTLVGSKLFVKDSIKRLVDNYSVPLVDAIKMASLNPLRMLGIKDRGELREGMKADISVFDRDFTRCVLQIFDGRVTFRR